MKNIKDLSCESVAECIETSLLLFKLTELFDRNSSRSALMRLVIKGTLRACKAMNESDVESANAWQYYAKNNLEKIQERE